MKHPEQDEVIDITPAEVARKNKLIAQQSPLTPEQWRVARCAECILAQQIDKGELPHFTSEKVRGCTGASERVFRYFVSELMQQGFLQKGTEASENVYPWRKTRAVYSPIAKEEDFLIPRKAVDCERTEISASPQIPRPEHVDLHEAIKSPTASQQIVLGCIACLHGAQREVPQLTIDSSKISKCLDQTSSTVNKMLLKLSEAGHLVVANKNPLIKTRHNYSLTEKGEVFATTASPLMTCELQNHLANTPAIPPKIAGIDNGVLNKIHEACPQQHKATIIHHLRALLKNDILLQRSIGTSGVASSPDLKQSLRLAMPYQSNESAETRYLMFNPAVLQEINPTQCQAIAQYLGLDVLLFGKRLDPQKLAEALSLNSPGELGTHVRQQLTHLKHLLKA